MISKSFLIRFALLPFLYTLAIGLIVLFGPVREAVLYMQQVHAQMFITGLPPVKMLFIP